MKYIKFTGRLLLLFVFFQVSVASEQISLLNDNCSKEDMYSCQKLGLLYKNLKEHDKANKYFNVVCDNNISDGCMSLATYYHLLKRKYALTAFEYYKKACNLNNSHACNNLGNFYRNGKYADKNLTKAIDIFEKSYCLNPRDKPFRNRALILQDSDFFNYKKDEIDCSLLQIDESMDTASQVDDESAYQ